MYTDFEIILLDNGSSDGSIEFVNQNFPYVQVIFLGQNLGFAGAVNIGILRTHSPYIALLNNDIELESHWLEILIHELKSHSEVGAAAGKMLNFFSRGVIDAAGDMLTRSLSGWARGFGEKDVGQYDVEEFVFGPCAGAAVYKREVFEQVGLFDETFFAFYEDIDLDFRMQMQGWKVLYVYSAVCYHKRGATAQSMYGFAVRLHVRNHIFYLIKNLPLQIFLKKLPLIIAARLKNWYEYTRGGYFLEVVRALGDVILKLPEMFAKRREIQAKRSVSLRYIESLLKK